MKQFRLTLLLLPLWAFTALTASADTRFVDTQSTDTDCGPAALSTLLNYYLRVPTNENEMVKLTKARPGEGTTFQAMEEAAKAKGCAAEGYRMTYATLDEQLRTYPTPVIVRMLMPTPHFMVVLAMDTQYVFLADPATGNIILRKDAFLQRWLIPASLKEAKPEGYVFVAAGPLNYNDANRQYIVKGLRQQLDNLYTIRQPVPAYRR